MLAQLPPRLQARLSIRGVTLRYRTEAGDFTAVRDVSIDVRKGDRLVLLGPSGCGKSTLLKAIGGFLPCDAGAIELDGIAITRPGLDRMMVFQEFDQLLPWKTVLGNVAFPLLTAGSLPRREALERAHESVTLVGLERFANAYPHTLSGGMKQRVAIARALAVRPDVLLMDEPFGALDALNRRRMQDELLGLWERFNFTLIFVTHGIEEAILVGDRVLVMSPSPGRILADIDVSGFSAATRIDPSFGRLETELEDMLMRSDGPLE
jgi:NitT/TauT family transport system ATP-binding protein